MPTRLHRRGPVGVTMTTKRPAFTGRASRGPRAILQGTLLWPLVRLFCRPRTVVGSWSVPDEPVIFVANHSSHADTALILRSLPQRIRQRTHPAAAEDHFWRHSFVGAFVSLLTGAFPFPRKGPMGLVRADEILRRGDNVLLFPEGTRSIDGTLGDFHCGVVKLAARGYRVVPVAIAGAREVLPKGRVLPRRARISVVFGEPIDVGDVTPPVGASTLRAAVALLIQKADRVPPPPRETVFERLTRFAKSRAALVFALAWAFAEALYWPVIPDFYLFPLASVAPRRIPKLIGAAVIGTVSGGLVAFAIGTTSFGAAAPHHLPLVTNEMVEFAAISLGDGPQALLGQPWTGVPYKVYAFQAAPKVDLDWFLLTTGVARGSRFIVVALAGAAIGALFCRVTRRVMGPLLVVYMLLFTLGLARVVARWNDVECGDTGLRSACVPCAGLLEPPDVCRDDGEDAIDPSPDGVGALGGSGMRGR